MNSLFETWKTLCKLYDSEHQKISECYNEIESAYREPQRYYHTLEHIRSMIKDIQVSADSNIDKPLLLWAAYFHDVIYDPRAKNNELKSSEKAGQVMKQLHVPEQLILRTKELILATADHTKAGSGPNLDLFLDCDLRILGAAPEEYKLYAENIRNEYKHVPAIIYNHERKKVLKRFITTPAIYRTTHFYGLYEKQARINILNEIERL